MNIDNLITLIVPVRDRHYNLPSILHYYKDTKFRKIIYDASVNPYEGDHAGFEYYHAGPEFQTVSYLNSHSLAKTPYLINCPDDDIMTIESLEMCVKFLEENPSYSACDGSVMEFNPDVRDVKPVPKEEVYQARVLHNWENENIDERLDFAIVQCSRSCLHSVLRTKQSVKILQNFIDNKEITPLSFLDRVYTFATLCMGPIKTLQVPHHIRTANQRTNADRVMFDKKIANEVIDGFSLQLDVAMADHIDKFHCSKFSDFLSENAKISKEEAVEKTIKIFKKHFATRAKNGGGGYFGPSIPLDKVILPYKNQQMVDIILKAVMSMEVK